MQRKVFIAINFDERTKQYIEQRVKSLESKIEGKWVPAGNYHITILYLGFIDDEEMIEYCKSLRKALGDIRDFELEFNSIGWGPDEQKKKMIWVKGKESEELVRLRNIVESVTIGSQQQNKKFSPHITCARIRKRVAMKIDDIIFKQIERFSFPVAVQSIDVMEVLHEKGGSVYKPLDIIELK